MPSFLANPQIIPFAQLISYSGSPSLLILISLGAAISFYLNDRKLLFGFVLTALLGGTFINLSIKNLLQIPRPTPLFPEVVAFGYRFPSGHTLGSTLFYLGFLYLIWPQLKLKSKWTRRTCMVTCITLPILIGLSRIVLGVHKPIDVMAGFCLGAGWLAISILIYKHISDRQLSIEIETFSQEPHSTAVLINQHAGTNRDIKTELQPIFEKLFPSENKHPTLHQEKGIDIPQRANKIIKKGIKTLVIGGGDGSINSVVNTLIGSNTRLAILPLGTLNHFAKDLGIPLNLQDAVSTILTGEEIEVDVGMVNGQAFINNSSIGFYPLVVRRRNQEMDKLGKNKWVALFSAAWRVFKKNRIYEVEIQADNKTFILQTPFVFVGNNEYNFNLPFVCRRESLNRGRLFLYTCRKSSRWALLRLALRSAFFGFETPQDLEIIQAKSIIVRSKRNKIHVAFDGEVRVFPSPLHYYIQEKAIRVLVPKRSSTPTKQEKSTS